MSDLPYPLIRIEEATMASGWKRGLLRLPGMDTGKPGPHPVLIKGKMAVAKRGGGWAVLHAPTGLGFGQPLGKRRGAQRAADLIAALIPELETAEHDFSAAWGGAKKRDMRAAVFAILVEADRLG